MTLTVQSILQRATPPSMLRHIAELAGKPLLTLRAWQGGRRTPETRESYEALAAAFETLGDEHRESALALRRMGRKLPPDLPSRGRTREEREKLPEDWSLDFLVDGGAFGFRTYKRYRTLLSCKHRAKKDAANGHIGVYRIYGPGETLHLEARATRKGELRWRKGNGKTRAEQ